MKILLSFLLIIFCLSCSDQNRIEYFSGQELQKEIVKGWNTWDNRNILSHVYLPQGLAIHIKVVDELSGDTLKYAFTGNKVMGTEKVRTLYHTPDGSYTDFTMTWKDISLRTQSVSDKKDITILITNLDLRQKSSIIIEPYFLYGGKGEINLNKDQINVETNGTSFNFKAISWESNIDPNELQYKLGDQLIITTLDIDENRAVVLIIETEKFHDSKVSSYGNNSEIYKIIQNSLNWLVV